MMPRWVILGGGWILGVLWYDVLRIRREVVDGNLQRAFPRRPAAERRSLARASVVSLGRTLLEFAFFPRLTTERALAISEVHGEDHLRGALAAGKGAFLLTLHLGNGDLAVSCLSRRGWRMNLVSKSFKSQRLNRFWFELRESHGTRLISHEKSSFEILRALRRNEFVAFVLDQFMGPPVGVRTRFFGSETGTAVGLALMASRSGAPVLPAYTVRTGDGRHQIYIEAPLDNGPEGETLEELTQRYTDKIEEIVARYPDQWMWIHRRWKTF